jgi:predicted nucleic acid-binding Zn ribbon protein
MVDSRNTEECLMGHPERKRRLRTYKCLACGEKFDAYTSDSQMNCECGGLARETLSLPTSRPQFKCGGFHDTDYKEK